MFHKYEYIFSSWSKQIFWNRHPQFRVALMGEAVSTYVSSTDIVSLSLTTYDVTLRDDSNLHGSQASKA
jgi:hypothetical protein